MTFSLAPLPLYKFTVNYSHPHFFLFFFLFCHTEPFYMLEFVTGVHFFSLFVAFIHTLRAQKSCKYFSEYIQLLKEKPYWCVLLSLMKALWTDDGVSFSCADSIRSRIASVSTVLFGWWSAHILWQIGKGKYSRQWRLGDEAAGGVSLFFLIWDWRQHSDKEMNWRWILSRMPCLCLHSEEVLCKTSAWHSVPLITSHYYRQCA